jgi:hypothetical protein
MFLYKPDDYALCITPTVNVADNEPIDVDDVDLFSVAGSVHDVSLLENNVGLEGTAKQLAPEVLSVSSEETSPDAKLNFHACSIKSSVCTYKNII